MIKEIKINKFRGFENNTLKLGKYITILSGRNATGKSTLLGMLGNCAELKKKEGVPYQRSSFRAEFCELFKASEQYDLTGSGLYQISLCNSDGEEIDYRHFRITWQKDNKK